MNYEKGKVILLAIIKEKRIEKKIEVEQKKQKTLKKKMEIQQKKMDFGEDWRKNLSEKRKKEIENLVGDVEAPNLIDSIDINTFFDPISFYKNNNDEKIDFDYKKYIDAELAYKEALEDIDNLLAGKGERDINEEIDDNLANKNEKKVSILDKLPGFLKKNYADWTKYFNRFVPLYDRYVCTCCGQPLTLDKFFPQYVETNLARIEPDGKMHTSICIDCCKRIYEYLFYTKAEKDPVLAMKWFCSYINVYYNEAVYYQARDTMEKNKRKNHIVYEYMQIINRMVNYKNKTFLDSDVGVVKYIKNNSVAENENVSEENSGENGTQNSSNKNITGYENWSVDDLKNRKLVIKMVGYDPFDYESEENRKQLYSDLLGMLEQGMEMDQVKLQAAIQIVFSFLRVRELNKTYRDREKENANVQELKNLADLKKKELDIITNFSRDNGFTERYAAKKSKGDNSFTGIMNKMDEQKFEDALVNKYDIATSSTIQQAAEASFKAIINQLGLGEAEIWQTCQKQLKEIENLRRENMKLTEDLRTTKYELAKIKLTDLAKEKGTLEDEDDVDDKFGGY